MNNEHWVLFKRGVITQSYDRNNPQYLKIRNERIPVLVRDYGTDSTRWQVLSYKGQDAGVDRWSLGGSWIYRNETEPYLGVTGDKDTRDYFLSYGGNLCYTGTDKVKAQKMFEILKEMKEAAKDAETTVSLLITA